MNYSSNGTSSCKSKVVVGSRFTGNANITTNKKGNIIMEVIEVIDIFLLLGSSSNGTFSYKNGRVR